MTDTNRPLRVFLCHSSNDKPLVRELYKKLRAKNWIRPWLDEEELYPGQYWNLEIEKAVESADAIIVCLSNNSITKEGYVQRELRIALDYADYKPEDTLYIIPVRLEDCELPRRLRPWQYADYFPKKERERAFKRLLVSLKKRADSFDLKFASSAPEGWPSSPTSASQAESLTYEKPVEKKKPIVEKPMLVPYLDRLVIIVEMLDSHQRETVHEAYDLLFQLWLKFSDNPDFSDHMGEIAQKHPELVQEFIDRLNKFSGKEGEKAILLKKSFELLFQPPKKVGKKMLKMTAPKIFISYSHEDESFKNELVTMLAGLQRRGIIDAWQDRRIEAGEEWFDAIWRAMKECNIAVLLVSPDFIASRFIQEEELARLFERRIEEGLRVVPIIIRPCLWQSEPVIKDLQALPKNAKPVISFSKDNGDRDQAWIEIGAAIENVVKRIVNGS